MRLIGRGSKAGEQRPGTELEVGAFELPKSGFSANSQAKVCANAVRGALTGSRVFPAKFSNTSMSVSFSVTIRNRWIKSLKCGTRFQVSRK